MTVTSEQRESGRIIAVAGESQSGKTSWVIEMLHKFDRVAVFDVRGDYHSGHGFQRVKTFRELIELTAQEKFRVSFAGPARVAPDFADVMYAASMERANTMTCLEETSDYSHAGKAPPGVGDFLRKVKAMQGHVIAVTQFPAESDKTSWKNSDAQVCFRMQVEADREYMRSRGFPIEEIPNVAYQGRMRVQDKVTGDIKFQAVQSKPR